MIYKVYFSAKLLRNMRYRTTECACGNPKRSWKQAYCNECHARYMKLMRMRGKFEPTEEQKIKRRASALLNSRIKRGKIIRPDQCSNCGNRCKVEGHHEDYYKPLDVKWLCKKCHVNHHYNKKHDIQRALQNILKVTNSKILSN